MGIENGNPNAERVDYSSQEAQEQLAKNYLKAHEEYTALMARWQEQLQLKDRFDAESGHNPGSDEIISEYRRVMNEISDEMELKQKAMREAKSFMHGETVDRFLR